MRYFISLFLIFLLTPICIAEQINVPDDYPSIQQGLNSASVGDTVFVSSGTYQENVIWPETNGIKLIGEDSSNTIIDGSGNSSVIYMNPQNVTIDSTTLIQELTIANGGNVQNGGGMFIANSSPWIFSVTFEGNIIDGNGGGVYYQNSTAKLTNSRFIGNNAYNGAALYLTNSSGDLSELKIINNGESIRGGGIYLQDSPIIISNSTILKNNAVREGGGVYASDSDIELIEIIIANNICMGSVSLAQGGGLYLSNSDIIPIQVLVSNNTAGHGGGIYVDDNWGSPFNESSFEELTIINNTALLNGGGVYFQGSSLIYIDGMTVTNNNANDGGGIYFANSSSSYEIRVNVVENTASRNGGGLYLYEGSLSFSETVITRNQAGENGGGAYINNSAPDFTHSTIDNNTALDLVDGINDISGNTSISNSILQDNDQAISNINNSNIIQCTNNFWGNSSGPYHPTQNPTGTGDSTNQWVNVDPWLSAPDTASPPATVKNLEINELGSDYVSLTWDSSAIGDLAGYHLYYTSDTSSIFFTDTISVGGGTTYTINNLQAGNIYRIAVTCYDDDGNESWYSVPVNITPSPAPIIQFSQTSIVFDSTTIGDTLTQQLTIENTGTADLHINEINTSDPQFSIEIDETVIAPDEQNGLTIEFHPEQFGAITDTLTVVSDAYNSAIFQVPLTGFGDKPAAPSIFSINDIPGDQGGLVRINFFRSKYDGLDTTSTIVSYSVWRQIENDEWDAIGQFDAVGDSIYHYVAQTLYDSTSEGIYWSKFRVSSHTVMNDTFYFSEPDSGYSIDNIAPGVPENLNAMVDSIGIALEWGANSVQDFQYFAVYRSQSSNFDIDTIEAISTTIDTVFVDSDTDLGVTYYYRITAIDDAGNESLPSNTVSGTMVGVHQPNSIPNEFSLSQNYPNPFNPLTNIKYGLPKPSHVRLLIYDIAGRKVKTLVQESQDSGWYQIQWNGTDDLGEKVSTGVYFYRFESDDFVDVKKLVFMK